MLKVMHKLRIQRQYYNDISLPNYLYVAASLKSTTKD